MAPKDVHVLIPGYLSLELRGKLGWKIPCMAFKAAQENKIT